MNNITITVFEFLVLICSVIMHEISHGAVALMLGDDTAKKAGRLTLNPIKHIDPFGSIIVPLLLALPSLVGGGPPILFGWAKPVPYNPMRLKNPKIGGGIIALVGPLSNLCIALVFALAMRVIGTTNESLYSLLALFNIIVYINIVLAVFNLVPIPPLDGSNVLFSFLPDRFNDVKFLLSRYGFMILIAFVFFGGSIIAPIIDGIYRLMVGSALMQ